MTTSKSQPLHTALLTRNLSAMKHIANRHSCDNGTLVELASLMTKYSQKGTPITPMQAGVMTGNYRICKQLLAEGADTTTRSIVPPPLCLALDMDRFQIARLLIDSGASVFLSHQGMYPMFYAVKPNTPEFIVEAIIKAGFLPDSIIEEKSCSTALHAAVASENVAVVKVLLKQNADCNIKETQLGFTPLLVAVNAKLPLMAKLLINNGADLEVENKLGMTPLFHAICQNNLSFVNLLLQSGADVHHVSSETLNYPLNLAAAMGDIAIVKALLSKGADPSRAAPGSQNLPLHDVVANSLKGKPPGFADNLKEIVELLIENGSEVDALDKSEFTPVQLALQEHNFKVVEVLIKGGAAINQEFTAGIMFHHVVTVANKELVSLFLEYGADHCMEDANGNTPYDLAMFNPDPTVSCMFWKFGYPFNSPPSDSPDNLRYSPELLKKLALQKKMMSGLERNNTGLLREVLSKRAEARCCSMDIPYPLHFATSNGFCTSVLLLLENGVPANSINDNGESPLHIAARKGYFQICRYLLRHGACYNLLSKPIKKTPLDLASEGNHYEIVCILKEIDSVFKSSATKTFKELQGIFENTCNVLSLQAYINCINRGGNTLMSMALKRGNIGLAEKLMQMRLQIIKA